MSDENVGGLVIQWRHNAQGCGRRDAQAAATWRSCARELEATLSAHGGLLFTQADMERFAGYVADAREERLKSAHGENASVPQPVVDVLRMRVIAEHLAQAGKPELAQELCDMSAALTGATP